MSDEQPAIIVKDLYKSFKLPHEQQSGIKQLVVNFFKRKKGYEVQEVLKDVSFEIKKGDFFGIVGRNGSGKSTLLKLLAGIYAPDSGLIQVNGTLTPFIELGVGFNPELTGRENVFMNGALLGFGHKEMEGMYEDIVEFAELDRFMDQKLKNYSSGMQVRLAFSIAIRAQSDILILDEVLAVGDQAFQQKCYTYFDQLKARGQTVVLVTHDMNAVKQFCNKALLLNKGQIVDFGEPHDISLNYEKLNFSSAKKDGSSESESTKSIITIKNTSGEKINSAPFDSDIVLTLNFPKDQGIEIVGFVITKNGEEIFATNTIDQKIDLSKGEAKLFLKQKLGNGRYKIVAGLFGNSRHDVVEFIEGPELVIFNQPKTGVRKEEWHGLVYIESAWK